MQDRQYVINEASVPEPSLPDRLPAVEATEPLDGDIAPRIEAKLDLILAAMGVEVADYGATD